MRQNLFISSLLFSLLAASPVSAAELTISQRVTAQQMKEIVFTKAIAQRISELCADYTVDDAKLAEQRDAVMAIAQTSFSSGQSFMEAAGINEKAKMGEELRRFFLDRGVSWDSSAKQYCALAEALITVQAPVSTYLVKRK